MPLTTNSLPYPAASDIPDVPHDIQALAEAINPYAKSPVWGFYGRTANQAIATGQYIGVIGTQIAMEGGLVLNAATGQVTIPVGGLYLLNGWATWNANATGARFVNWARNNTILVRVQGLATAASLLTQSCMKVTRLAAGDKLDWQVWQSSGVALALDGNANYPTGYDIIRLAP